MGGCKYRSPGLRNQYLTSKVSWGGWGRGREHITGLLSWKFFEPEIDAAGKEQSGVPVTHMPVQFPFYLQKP